MSLAHEPCTPPTATLRILTASPARDTTLGPMLKWSLTALGVALVIAFVYFRTLASVEELDELELTAPAPAESPLRSEAAPTSIAGTSALAREPVPLEVQPPAAAPRRPSIRGRVLTPDGTPYGQGLVRFATVRHGRAELEEARTTSDGAFELIPADSSAHGDLLVSAARHEFAPVAQLGVTASDAELEFRLLPPSTFAVRLRDARGIELEPHRLSFHWILAGVTREDREDALGKLRWARSPVPFRIHVKAVHVLDEWLGPFEPGAVGEVLELEVRRRHSVRGIVLAGGAPVPGAEVRLERLEDPSGERGRVFGGGRTDERGEFWFRVDEPGVFRPVAFHSSHGRGQAPELRCGDADLDGLTIKLSEPPGRIEGRILLPDGRSTALLAVEFAHRLRTPRADGTFLLPDVEPGVHVLRLVGGDPEDPRDSWTWHRGQGVPGLAYTPSWSVEVRPGAASSVVLDLSAPRAVRLEGRIDLGRDVEDASTFGNREALGVYFWREGGTGLETQAVPSRQGEFAAEFESPGQRRFEFHLQLGALAEGGSWRVRDVLDLAPGVQHWDLTLAPGALRLRAPGVDLMFEPEPKLHWQGAGELTIEVPGSLSGMVESTPGSVLYHAVPPGLVRFTLVPDGATYEASVRSGETTEFLLPESARAELEAAYDQRTEGIALPSYLTEIGY